MATKILLVEDDPLLIDIYLTKLRAENFEVEIARDGEEAINKWKEFCPDLIILDIVLPNNDGWEVLKKIRQEDSSTKILILSNLSQKEEVEKGLQLGADIYLIKSEYTPSEVINKIKQLLST